MSEPSPEPGIQARINVDGHDYMLVSSHYALLNEETAKLREEYEEILEQAWSIATATAKLREYYEGRMTTEWHKGFAACAEAHEQNKLAHQQPSDEDIKREPALAKRFIEGLELELAEYHHQQPSVIRRNPNEDHRAAQPSTPTAELIVTKDGVPFEDQAEGIRQFKAAALRPPTADVEKIVMEFANNEYEENKLRKVIAQARAPLVKAGKQAIPRLERCMCAGSDGRRLNLKIAKTLAALTGTGEK